MKTPKKIVKKADKPVIEDNSKKPGPEEEKSEPFYEGEEEEDFELDELDNIDDFDDFDEDEDY